MLCLISGRISYAKGSYTTREVKSQSTPWRAYAQVLVTIGGNTALTLTLELSLK